MKMVVFNCFSELQYIQIWELFLSSKYTTRRWRTLGLIDCDLLLAFNVYQSTVPNHFVTMHSVGLNNILQRFCWQRIPKWHTSLERVWFISNIVYDIKVIHLEFCDWKGFVSCLGSCVLYCLLCFSQNLCYSKLVKMEMDWDLSDIEVELSPGLQNSWLRQGWVRLAFKIIHSRLFEIW